MVLKRTINRKGKNTIMIRTHGHKLIRISVLLCVISTGCKLIPIIIMKGKKERIIKKINKLDLIIPKKALLLCNGKAWCTEGNLKIFNDSILEPYINKHIFNIGHALMIFDSETMYKTELVKNIFNKGNKKFLVILFV